MNKAQPKKQFQIRRLFGLAKPNARDACMDIHDYLADLAHGVTDERTSSLKELTFDEANKMIVALGGTAFALVVRSKRTENYRKQSAGIKSIETDAQLKLIDELAGARGWTAVSLEKFCQRMIKKTLPTTTEEGNKIVEGLKAMNKREGILPFKSKPAPIAEDPQPSFRRVA